MGVTISVRGGLLKVSDGESKRPWIAAGEPVDEDVLLVVNDHDEDIRGYLIGAGPSSPHPDLEVARELERLGLATVVSSTRKAPGGTPAGRIN